MSKVLSKKYFDIAIRLVPSFADMLFCVIYCRLYTPREEHNLQMFQSNMPIKMFEKLSITNFV